MNAIELLEKQHRKVEALFKKLEGGRGDGHALAVELANNLAAHMAIEQDIFYPAIVNVDPDLLSESFEEHALAETAVKRLLDTEEFDERFKARVVAAKELIEHHVKEEEEDLFKSVKKALSEDELEELGVRMKARFQEVYEAGYPSVVPASLSKTSADAARRKLHIDVKTKKRAA